MGGYISYSENIPPVGAYKYSAYTQRSKKINIQKLDKKTRTVTDKTRHVSHPRDIALLTDHIRWESACPIAIHQLEDITPTTMPMVTY